MSVLDEVAAERRRQDEKFGQQDWPDGTPQTGTAREHAKVMADSARANCETQFRDGLITWDDILDEEIWEARAEWEPDRLRAELIQVAAVAVAWVEAIDRRQS